MSQEAVFAEVLSRKKNRALAIILDVKESQCDRHLPADASRALRKVVLDQLNEVYELAFDIIRSLDNGTYLVNEEWLNRIAEIHQAVVPQNGRRPARA